jgi:hypothetical protein
VREARGLVGAEPLNNLARPAEQHRPGGQRQVGVGGDVVRERVELDAAERLGQVLQAAVQREPLDVRARHATAGLRVRGNRAGEVQGDRNTGAVE